MSCTYTFLTKSERVFGTIINFQLNGKFRMQLPPNYAVALDETDRSPMTTIPRSRAWQHAN